MNGTKKIIVALAAATFLGLPLLRAQDGVPHAAANQAIEAFNRLDQWDVRTFRVPSGYSFSTDVFPQNEAAADRLAKIQSFLEAQVGELPAGTTLLADSQSGTLAVRSTHEAFQRIDDFCHRLCLEVPQIITFELEVFETAAAVEEPSLVSLVTSQDHEAYAASLRNQVAKGEASRLAQVQAQGKSGGRVSVTNEQDGPGPSLMFEVEPTLGLDDIVSGSFKLEVRHPGAKGASGRNPSQVATVTSGTSVRSGSMRVIGMWKPWGVEKDPTRVAVLKTRVNPMLPAKNDQLQKQLLDLHGTKASTSAEIRVPEGMELRTLHCHVNLFHLWYPVSQQNGVPDDPFASVENRADAAPKSPSPIRPIHEGLKQQGIAFPEGSRVYWHRESSTLVVINTPGNLDQIQFLTESLCGVRPSLLVHELLVVQGNRAVVEALAAEADEGTDHSRAWQSVQSLLAKGELKRAGFLRAETRSGQRMLAFAGLCDDAESEESLGKSRKGSTDDGEDGEEAPPVQTGTRLEADSVLGPDGYTIDSVLHFIQHPSQKGGHATPPPPAVDLFTSTSLARGTPRLLLLRKVSDGNRDGRELGQAVFLRVSRYDVNP